MQTLIANSSRHHHHHHHYDGIINHFSSSYSSSSRKASLKFHHHKINSSYHLQHYNKQHRSASKTTTTTLNTTPTATISKPMASSLAAAASASSNTNSTNSTTTTTSSSSKWAQKTVSLPPLPRGCHLITNTILKEIGKDLAQFNCGLAHLFLQHTSASLTINENYDSDVRHDTETFLNTLVPEGPSAPWQHTLEGPDDMPAHIKSSMFGCSLMIPISKGRLNMGTWQGIWLCEHRDLATPRNIVVTLNGI